MNDKANTSNGSTVFQVPALPRYLKRVPALKHFDRPQMVGYDMRTLRKQIDLLYNEMEIRVAEHSAIYEQNCELWRYVCALVEAQRNNAQAMRAHSSLLRDELLALHAERRDARALLRVADGAQEHLGELARARERAHSEMLSDTELLVQAQMELRAAEEDASALETEAADKESRLSGLESSMEDMRASRRQELSDSKADEFFARSKAVLRRALAHFTESVSSSVRHRSARARAVLMCARRVLRVCWRLWRAFLLRRAVMLRNTRSRDLELKLHQFSRWRVFSALQKHCGQMRRRRLLRLGFGTLKEHFRQQLWNQWAVAASGELESRRRVRRVFGAWRRTCLFIEWTSPTVAAAERRALRFFASKVIRAWRSVSAQQACRLEALVGQVRQLRLLRVLAAWSGTVKHRFRRREEMKASFFRRVCDRAANRTASCQQIQSAMSVCIGLKKLSAFRRWMRYVRARLRSGARRKLRTVGRHTANKLAERALLMLTYYSALHRRLRAAYTVGVRHCDRKVLLFLRDYTRAKIGNRTRRRSNRLRVFFESWAAYVPQQKKRRAIDAAVEGMHESTLEKQQRACVARWRSLTLRSRVLKRSSISVHRKHTANVLHAFFRDWRGAWGRAMFWREKELKVERTRLLALNEMKAQELQYLEQEKMDLLRNGKELVAALGDLQSAVLDKEKQVGELRGALLSIRESKASIESTLEEAKTDLELTKQERERFRTVEMVYESERQRDESEVKQRRLQAETLLRSLKHESDALKGDVVDAREQAYAVERAAKHGISIDLDLLSQSQLASSKLKALVEEKKTYLRELETGIVSLQEDISRIQSRIHETSRSGIVLLDESERELRKKSARVKGLRANRGQAEAQVMALRDAIDERRHDAGRSHLKETSAMESRELSEIRNILENTSQTLLSDEAVSSFWGPLSERVVGEEYSVGMSSDARSSTATSTSPSSSDRSESPA